MLQFVIRRLLAVIPVLFVVAVVVFLILRLTPGDPAAVIAGNSATLEDIANIRKQLGLDEPLLTQFGIWFKGILTGNLGHSFYFRLPVTELIGQRLEPTFMLALCTITLAQDDLDLAQTVSLSPSSQFRLAELPADGPLKLLNHPIG